MRVRFFGTKGYVDAKSRAHSGHSAFTVEAAGFRLLEADRTTLWGVEGDPFDVPVLVRYKVEG